MAKRKGPTWAQINEAGSNQIETRSGGGYIRKRSEMGRTRVDLKCPFCKTTMTAYLWSLAACGKRCTCGAMCSGRGDFHHFAHRS